MKREIASEIYRAMERLGAESDLLSIIGSYGDTLDDDDILSLLKSYNKDGVTLHQLRS